MSLRFHNVSYTLRRVYDDLKSRLSLLSQNGKNALQTDMCGNLCSSVTAYDHMMYLEHDITDQEFADKVDLYYSRL